MESSALARHQTRYPRSPISIDGWCAEWVGNKWVIVPMSAVSPLGDRAATGANRRIIRRNFCRNLFNCNCLHSCGVVRRLRWYDLARRLPITKHQGIETARQSERLNGGLDGRAVSHPEGDTASSSAGDPPRMWTVGRSRGEMSVSVVCNRGGKPFLLSHNAIFAPTAFTCACELPS